MTKSRVEVICGKCDENSYYGLLLDGFGLGMVIGVICHKCGNTHYFNHVNRFSMCIERKLIKGREEVTMRKTCTKCMIKPVWKDGLCGNCWNETYPNGKEYRSNPKMSDEETKAMLSELAKGPYMVWLPIGVGYQPKSYESLDKITEDINNGTLATQTLITRKVSVKISLVEE
jgi:hypothetical protein